MSWDEAETVLTRSKLKWLQDQTVARQGGKPRDTRFDFVRQLYALCMKNVHLRVSLGLYFFPLVVILPILAVLCLALIDTTTNVPPVIETPTAPFFALGFAPVASILRCAVFEPLRGSKIGGAWCSPMLFAPTANADVSRVMDEVAARNNWVARTLSSAEARRSTRPSGCDVSNCVLGFTSVARLGDWLEANPGRAATAIVFVEQSAAVLGSLTELGGETLPDRVAFEVWYNTSALPLYAADGADALASFNETSALIVAAQHEVQEAVLSRKLSGASLKVSFRRYPRLRTARYYDVQRFYGLLAINLPVSLHAVGLLVQIVSEKELGMLAALRAIGMWEATYWLSFYLQHAAEALIMACCMYAAGTIVRLPMFAQTDLWVWLSAIWLFSMAACGTACLLAVVVHRRTSASVLGTIGVICASFIALWPSLADLRFATLLATFQDPYLLPVHTGVLEFMYPPFALLKVVFDITQLTQRTPQLDEETGITTLQASGTYTVDDLWTGGYGLGPFDSLASGREAVPRDEWQYELRPTAVSFNWLALRALLSFVLTWYLAQVVTSGQGRARHPFFFLAPSFWLPPAPRGNVPLLNRLRLRGDHDQLTHLDVDVAAEAHAVLGGNLPDEKPVVLYDVHKVYARGRAPAVHGLSVSLEEHELFALLGRNGAGKTTIVNMLATLRRISRGDMILYGASVENDVDAVRRMIGRCAQFDILHASLSAAQHLHLFGRFYGVHRAALRARVPDALAEVNLSAVANKRTASFSGGMKRRLSLACTYVGEPRVVALDEPTTGMDPYNRKRVWDMIISKKLHGRTTLLCTHSMEEAEVLAHTVGILHDGQLVALGSAPHLKRRFGAGYTIKLVTRRTDLHALMAKVSALVPDIHVVESSHTACTYSIREDQMARAGKLLRYIESVKKESDEYIRATATGSAEPHSPRAASRLAHLGFESPRDAAGRANDGHGRAALAAPPPSIILKDWLVAHTSLEEVFITRLRQHHPLPDAPIADPAGDAIVGDGGGGDGGDGGDSGGGAVGAPAADPYDATPTNGSERAPTVEAERDKARPRQRQLRAAALKNVALSRRRPMRQCATLWCSGVLIALVYVLQIFLVDHPAEFTAISSRRLADELSAACGNVTALFDEACERRASLVDEPVCALCAQPDWPSYEACCIRANLSLANRCVRDQCVGQVGDVDSARPDWSSDCSARTAGTVAYPRPYCECTDADGGRSAALQARIDATPACAAKRRLVDLKPEAMPVEWVPTNRNPGALDRALDPPGIVDDSRPTWLGWRVPVFGGKELGSVQSKGGAAGGTFIGTYEQPIWGAQPTFPATAAARALRAASRELTAAQTALADAVSAQIDATGVLARFPRAVGRTSFQTSRGQPSEECTAVRSATKCCYVATLINFGPYDFGRRIDVCSELGGECPERDEPVGPFLRERLGWTAAEVSADANVNISERSASLRLAVGADADFAGRPALCDGEVPPLCAAVYARDAASTANLTCTLIREAREMYLPLVNATELRWSADEWDADPSWECVDAQCVQYEAFVVPAYTVGEWGSQEELNEHVVREQAKVLADSYGDAAAVKAHAGVRTRLNVAEHLFPSWSVDVHALLPGNGTADFAITSFFRRAANGFFYVTEPLGDATGRTPYDVRLLDLERPHALEGQSSLSRGVPAMLINAFANALLQERLGESNELRVGTRPMPELARERLPFDVALIVDAMSIAALPAACMMMLPQITYALVQEKEYKVRMLTSMMGMPQLSYWLVEWAFASLASHLFLLVFWLVGTYMLSLTSFMRSKGALLIVLQVWAQLQVGIAFLASTLFQRARSGALFAALIVISSLASGATIYTLSLGELDNAPAWSALYDLWPPFAFCHCLWLVIRVQVSVQDLLVDGTEVSFALRLLLIHIAWVFPLAMYLDATLPRKFGIPESPCFCFRPEFYLRSMLKLAGGVPRAMPGSQCLRRCMPRLVAALRAVERGAVDARNSLSRDSVADAIEKDGRKEDADVRHERERIERGDYDSALALIQIFSLHKAYRERVALHNLTLKVDVDECFGLIGPNGAGKTTIISVLTGLYPPTKGNALVAGHDILRQMPQIYKSIGVCPQFDILWPDLTVREHLLFYSRVKGVPRATEEESVRAAAQNVYLGLGRLNTVVSNLSAGQKRRVSLAVSLLGHPDVIFLDEPTTGLDPESRRAVWQMIENSKAGRAIVLTTHTMEEADMLCTRVGILANGALRALGTSVHLKNKFGDGYKVDISFMPSTEERLSAFMRRVLPIAELDASRSWTGNRVYKVRKEDVSLARLFHVMDTRPDSVGIIHWGVRQTSLEEVFLIITSDYELQVDGSEVTIKTPRAAAMAVTRGIRLRTAALLAKAPKIAGVRGSMLELPATLRLGPASEAPTGARASAQGTVSCRTGALASWISPFTHTPSPRQPLPRRTWLPGRRGLASPLPSRPSSGHERI